MFLQVSTILNQDDVEVIVTTSINRSKITHAEPWMINGAADLKSIKIFSFGSDIPTRALMTLSDLAGYEGFSLIKVWKNHMQQQPNTVVVNVENIKALRPYVVRGTKTLDHYVMYMNVGKKNDAVDYHMDNGEAELLKVAMEFCKVRS